MALLLVFVAFATYTAIVFVDYGLIGFVEASVDNTAVVQVALDPQDSAEGGGSPLGRGPGRLP